MTNKDLAYIIAILEARLEKLPVPKDGKDGERGLDGKDGKDGVDGRDGLDGKDGKDGIDGKDGRNGTDGKNGIDGKNGRDGNDGKDGRDGKDGYSAYDIAVERGFRGSESEWLESLKAEVPEVTYDDAELRQLITDLKSLVETKADTTHSHDQYLTKDDIIPYNDVWIKEALSRVSTATKQEFDRVSRVVEGKASKQHSHPQYALKTDIKEYDDKWVGEKFSQTEKSTNAKLKKVVKDTESKLDKKSDKGHVHSQYAIKADVLKLERESEDKVREAISDIEKQLAELKASLREEDERILNAVDEKADEFHSHREFKQLSDKIDKVGESKANLGHSHHQYLTKTDVKKLLPVIPPQVEEAYINKNGDLILVKNNGDRINAGTVQIVHRHFGGGGGGGSSGSDFDPDNLPLADASYGDAIPIQEVIVKQEDEWRRMTFEQFQQYFETSPVMVNSDFVYSEDDQVFSN